MPEFRRVTAISASNDSYFVEATESAHNKLREMLQEDSRNQESKDSDTLPHILPADADLGIDWDNQTAMLLPAGALPATSINLPTMTMFVGQRMP